MALVIGKIAVQFQGVRALDGVSLEIKEQEIVAIIGPNGSGKTTLLNVVSGVLSPMAGTVMMGGRKISGLPSHRVAQIGIARTFQNIRLFRGMTVFDNVETAAAWSPRARGLLRARRATEEVIGILGLEAHAGRLVETLPYGIQRRVEVARATVTRPSYLLLDEPAAGLNEVESDRLLEMIFKVRELLGCGIALVDHDLRLVMRAAETVHVLSEGRTLAEGTPAEIRRDPAVIEAYLGTSEPVHDHSGDTA